MKDLYHNLKAVDRIAPQVVTSGGGAVNTGDVDLQGYEGALIEAHFGANNGSDTVNATNHIDVTVEHADDDGTGSPGSYSAVAAADVLGVTPASGVVFDDNGAAADDQVYLAGYIGGKRFVKVTVTPRGTLTNGTPLSVTVYGGHARHQPVN